LTDKLLIKRRSKPQTLFKKTSTRNFETAKGAPMFADIPKNAPKEEDSQMEDA
jgi:hypothetical protein